MAWQVEPHGLGRQQADGEAADQPTPLAGRVGLSALVLVLLGVAAGAYLVFDPEGGVPRADGAAGPVIGLPGARQDMSGVTSFPQVEDLKSLTPEEEAAYRRSGATRASVAVSNERGVRIVVLSVSVRSVRDAVVLRDTLAQLQRTFGLSDVDSPPGVREGINPAADGGPVTRAHYAAGRRVVRVDVQGKDTRAAARVFRTVLKAQLRRLPADG